MIRRAGVACGAAYAGWTAWNVHSVGGGSFLQRHGGDGRRLVPEKGSAAAALGERDETLLRAQESLVAFANGAKELEVGGGAQAVHGLVWSKRSGETPSHW